ncbi:MAG: tRNA1(Val) (adenine(37)-N6)-methyltransferase [Epulopiscium sp.]|nr:tRNA1(Val) (adenine(37)-N6)-methyltransferase [Candidatus Epulonipiscium sp.]
MQEGQIASHERIDDLGCKGYRMIQNPNLFCFGMDAVLLSHFAEVKEGEKVLDLGTGTGILPILLEAKTQGRQFIGLEIQKESVDLARRNVELNGLSNKIRIDEGDIVKAEEIYDRSQFQVIVSNPPYIDSQGGLKNKEDAKTIARHEVLCTLEDVIKAASTLLQVSGRLYMVHRPHRLGEIITLLRQYQLEPKKMRLVYPSITKEPNMVLIEAIRHGKPMLKVLPPLIVYEENGKYTQEIYEIYGMENEV